FAVNYGNSMIIANKDSFDALSPETQDKLRSIVAEEGPKTTAAFLVDEEAQKKSQSEAGMTLVDAADGDQAMAREKLAPYWEAWAEENGPEYVDALKTVRQAIGK
ncbi:MAG: ABC transporter substrate-binding protein, partial [Rhodobacteraceae bacterium]|nr:ABC transporter substrate-binding protein [Paracoccaceae bacterium]